VWQPEVHTCTRELHLPNYSSYEVLHTGRRISLDISRFLIPELIHRTNLRISSLIHQKHPY
jgi:hypothetical protein